MRACVRVDSAAEVYDDRHFSDGLVAEVVELYMSVISGRFGKGGLG